MIGIHQRHASLEVRERLAFPAEKRTVALTQLSQIVSEGLILSTCNRTEIYTIVPDRPNLQPIMQFLSTQSGLTIDELDMHTCMLEGDAVVRHVCRLAAGLESMVLGEDQIVAQLKDAIMAAQQQHAIGQGINRLMQHALAAGKAVRTQTGIARSHLSVVSVALDLARQSLGTLSGKRVLIIGAGQTAVLALKHLSDHSGMHVVIANRTFERAQQLAERYGGQAIPLADLPTALVDADVVLSCTSAPESVIDARMVQSAIDQGSHPQLLLDLAVPHDIDPAVGDLPGVQLVNVDDLQVICEANRAARASEITRADEIIDDSVAKFVEWWGTLQAAPTIRALREHAEAIRTAEVQRTLARLPQLSSQEQAAIHALSEAIVNKLLHHPVTALKGEASTAGLIGATQQLFQIEAK